MKCSKTLEGSPTSIVVILLTALVISFSREGDCTCIVSRHKELFGSRNENHCELEIYCVENLNIGKAIYELGLCAMRDYIENNEVVYTFQDESSIYLTTASIFWNNDLLNTPETRILSNSMKSIKILSFPKTMPDLVYEYYTETNPWQDRQIKFDLNIFSNFTQLLKINASHSEINSLETTIPWLPTELRHNVINIIDLSKNRIREIPKNCFIFFPNLLHLNLSHNHITAFDNLSFEGLFRLETLDISRNMLSEIGNTFFTKISKIKEISINRNNLTQIDQFNFKTTTELEQLDLSSNNIKSIKEEAFKYLTRLRKLDLSENNLTVVNQNTFKYNIQLNKLNLSLNYIQHIDSEAFQGTKINVFDINGICLTGNLDKGTFDGITTYTLDLSNSKITKLESEAFAGLHTQVLNLSANFIRDVSPAAFKSIENLKILDLSSNNLSTIAFDTNDLSRLLVLNAANNSIRNISKLFFSNFQFLEQLDLSDNCISSLERRLFINMSRLQYLDLSRNTLSISLQNQFFQGLHAVTKLLISNTHIFSLSNESFSALRNLKTVNVSHSQINIVEYDAFIGSYFIETLDISYNLLRKFHINCTGLKSLKILKLDNNEIQNVTHEVFKHLSEMEELNLANNDITILDQNGFKSLSHLKVLDVSYNNIINVENVIDKWPVSNLNLAKTKKTITFQNTSNEFIERLNLSLNDIDIINSVLLFKIKNVEYLDLTKNKINFIDKFSFQNLQKLHWASKISSTLFKLQLLLNYSSYTYEIKSSL